VDESIQSRSDNEKEALAKSNSLIKALGTTRIRDLSAVGLLSVAAIFYTGSKKLFEIIEGAIHASSYIGIQVKRIDKLEYDRDSQKEINKDFEQRHRNAERALRLK